MSAIDPMFYVVMYIVSYTLAWYTWKDEKGWFSRIMKFLLTGIIPIVSLMLFIWKLYNDPEQDQ
jgi:uncharacterized membrane protein YfhO